VSLVASVAGSANWCHQRERRDRSIKAGRFSGATKFRVAGSESCGVKRRGLFLKRVHRKRAITCGEREAQAKIASSSTCLAAQCFKYRLAGAKPHDFISESRCTELSIGRSRELRYAEFLSVVVTGAGPRVPGGKSRQESSDRMKATPAIGLATCVPNRLSTSAIDFPRSFALASSTWKGVGRGVVRTGREDGKLVGLMRKLLRPRHEENFVNSCNYRHLAGQRSGTQVANLWAKSQGVNSPGLFGRSSQV
jgi:hypothetical protein